METRTAEIIQKATDLFCKYGIKSISMDDLSREMGISKRTLYQSIADKEELVKRVVEHKVQEAISDLNIFFNPKLNALEQNFRFMLTCASRFQSFNPSFIFDLRKYYPSLFQWAMAERRKYADAANLSNLKQGIAEGFFYADMDPEIVCRLLDVLGNYVTEPSNEVFSERELMQKKIHRMIYTYHFRAICNEKGLQEMARLWHLYESDFIQIEEGCKNYNL